MKYCPGRLEKIKEWCRKHGVILTDDNIVECMDNWLIDLWNSQVSKCDTVYVIGDFSLHTAAYTSKILDKLNGKKFLVTGNHDGSSDRLKQKFVQICQMKEVKHVDDSGTKFFFELCHFPMLTWNRKEHGSIQLAGHSHGKLDEFNEECQDLRIDVGLDSKVSDYRFLTPDDILVYFYNKRECGNKAARNGKGIINRIKSFFNGKR